MAYFRAMSSAGGVTATITVTYDSTFYNKTMTCKNGTKTYTKTTTSSGSTTFNVYEEGTWTITCNDVSSTVNVVFSYTTQMAMTKTVTVYGAAKATISFSDTTGSKTVTLDSSGKGSVSITFIPPSKTITFTDTNVAKNPDNLSQKYSKTITITNSTTAIYVMPDGAIYWYGYKKYTLSPTSASPTFNTNDISSSPTGTYILFTPSINVSNYTKVKKLFQYVYTNSPIKLGTVNKPSDKKYSKVFFNVYYGQDTNCILGFNEDNALSNLYEFEKGHYTFKTYAVWLE